MMDFFRYDLRFTAGHLPALPSSRHHGWSHRHRHRRGRHHLQFTQRPRPAPDPRHHQRPRTLHHRSPDRGSLRRCVDVRRVVPAHQHIHPRTRRCGGVEPGPDVDGDRRPEPRHQRGHRQLQLLRDAWYPPSCRPFLQAGRIHPCRGHLPRVVDQTLCRADNVAGRVVTLNSRPYTLIGVAPEGFVVSSHLCAWTRGCR
jgi:hypothetical protein